MAAEPIAGYRHITRDAGISGGEPIVAGTRITVRHIVERVSAGESVDAVQQALPHLSPSQIHSALSYYYDHQSEIDALIAESNPETVLASLGLTLERIADGVAIARQKNSLGS